MTNSEWKPGYVFVRRSWRDERGHHELIERLDGYTRTTEAPAFLVGYVKHRPWNGEEEQLTRWRCPGVELNRVRIADQIMIGGQSVVVVMVNRGDCEVTVSGYQGDPTETALMAFEEHRVAGRHTGKLRRGEGGQPEAEVIDESGSTRWVPVDVESVLPQLQIVEVGDESG